MDRLAFEASEIDTNGITVARTDRLKNNTSEDKENSTGTYSIFRDIRE